MKSTKRSDFPSGPHPPRDGDPRLRRRRVPGAADPGQRGHVLRPRDLVPDALSRRRAAVQRADGRRRRLHRPQPPQWTPRVLLQPRLGTRHASVSWRELVFSYGFLRFPSSLFPLSSSRISPTPSSPPSVSCLPFPSPFTSVDSLHWVFWDAMFLYLISCIIDWYLFICFSSSLFSRPLP